MIRLTVNGETMQLYNTDNLKQLLESLHLGQKRIAVEVNHEIIPKSLHQSTRIREGDQVEIVRAIGGG
ncbi:sulfur carrier protein ThiS [Neptunomonas japonica]|uniref:Sulfur carrier protein n=1 Tax=Neptunomonas japonica JAMM 1380 TaxID=1441457 RepID=A0A7R6PH09_9GAMM|nr:sulfur carrier protein ThiS [Neptunomonas japonica]BBB29468.1 sulfur carrier protein [Neptunomonas japonica JAMM 1380]